jgi:hypothetical protein
MSAFAFAADLRTKQASDRRASSISATLTMFTIEVRP